MIFELERVSTNLQCEWDGLALVKVNIQKIQHFARTQWEAVRRRERFGNDWLRREHRIRMYEERFFDSLGLCISNLKPSDTNFWYAIPRCMHPSIHD